ncbi:hypothetical protein O3P69_017164 [Scylla paramamosain]|uniref:Phospholipase A2-like central domain-containing protein n=1 Tax=Scylla paramamosain TaxID=85552 RepID=A0AAW0TYX2_SCYPA
MRVQFEDLEMEIQCREAAYQASQPIQPINQPFNPETVEADDMQGTTTHTSETHQHQEVNSTRRKRSVFHLYNMVTCATSCNPLVYKGYGCYCGFLGSGMVVDGIDKCCKGHDWCYEHSSCFGFDHYLAPYRWKCNGGNPYCVATRGPLGGVNSCGHQLCECDREFVECLKQHPCPKTKAICMTSPWRYWQNLFMGLSTGSGMHHVSQHASPYPSPSPPSPSSKDTRHIPTIITITKRYIPHVSLTVTTIATTITGGGIHNTLTIIIITIITITTILTIPGKVTTSTHTTISIRHFPTITIIVTTITLTITSRLITARYRHSDHQPPPAVADQTQVSSSPSWPCQEAAAVCGVSDVFPLLVETRRAPVGGALLSSLSEHSGGGPRLTLIHYITVTSAAHLTLVVQQARAGWIGRRSGHHHRKLDALAPAAATRQYSTKCGC